MALHNLALHRRALNRSCDKFHLKLTVKRSLFKKETLVVKCLAFEQEGCVIRSDEVLTENQIIPLSALYSMEPMNIEIPELSATLVSKTKDCSCYLYQLKFTDICRTKYSRQLNQLEKLLNLHSSLQPSNRRNFEQTA